MNGENQELPEGYSKLPSVTSKEFARWLQQNRVRKTDLQMSIVDLIIDNLKEIPHEEK